MTCKKKVHSWSNGDAGEATQNSSQKLCVPLPNADSSELDLYFCISMLNALAYLYHFIFPVKKTLLFVHLENWGAGRLSDLQECWGSNSILVIVFHPGDKFSLNNRVELVLLCLPHLQLFTDWRFLWLPGNSRHFIGSHPITSCHNRNIPLCNLEHRQGILWAPLHAHWPALYPVHFLKETAREPRPLSFAGKTTGWSRTDGLRVISSVKLHRIGKWHRSVVKRAALEVDR